MTLDLNDLDLKIEALLQQAEKDLKEGCAQVEIESHSNWFSIMCRCSILLSLSVVALFSGGPLLLLVAASCVIILIDIFIPGTQEAFLAWSSNG